jgi:hypothetical protein
LQKNYYFFLAGAFAAGFLAGAFAAGFFAGCLAMVLSILSNDKISVDAFETHFF